MNAFLSQPKGGFHSEADTRCSLKISILESFAKFAGKHLYQSLFFNKVA